MMKLMPMPRACHGKGLPFPCLSLALRACSSNLAHPFNSAQCSWAEAGLLSCGPACLSKSRVHTAAWQLPSAASAAAGGPEGLTSRPPGTGVIIHPAQGPS
eukprot:356949-Chlamydomonas_euryale.AAC.5